MRWPIILAGSLLLIPCCDGQDETTPGPTGGGGAGGEAVNDVAIVPVVGEQATLPLDCSGAYQLPAEFTGSEGLGHHGWDLDDLTLTLAWAMDTKFVSRWISANDNSAPSMRVRSWLVPEASYCYVNGLRSAMATTGSGESDLAALVGELTGFAHGEVAYDGLYQDGYTPPDYDDGRERPLMGAIRGLYELPNPLPGAPVVEPWSDGSRDWVAPAIADYPVELDVALATVLLRIGEASLLKQQALAGTDPVAMVGIFDQFLVESYATQSTTTVSPRGGSVIDQIFLHGDTLGRQSIHAAAIAVAGATDELRRVLEDVPAFDSFGLDFVTPHGRVIVNTDASDTTYAAEQLLGTALVVDLGGNDTYHGRYASTHFYWMGASVVIDMAGNDSYSPEVADIEAEATTAAEAFDNGGGFTQGAGLFGVGLLVDAAGDDVYTASVYAQGSGAFGVGLLYDVAGTDTYKLGNAGQGAGYFGMGALVDGAGNDSYGLYTTGQGSGRPQGHGLLLDLEGDDRYVTYHNVNEPELPGPGYNNYFGLNGSTWPYSDDEGNPHYMSNSQGIGWGFRGDWFPSGPSSNTAWGGGFGALVDLGDGADEHLADCMTMGQGFVYGFGLLYDEGGSDHYRTFWWGPAAAAHMGVGALIDENGDDDIHVARLSGGYGFDCSVGWLIDNGGNDRYAGRFNYGKGYTSGSTFFINVGGDDEYNADSALTDPPFGIVHNAYPGAKLAGVFMDLGGGTDTYNTGVAGVGNDALWYLDPIGDNADPEFHKGVGIDK
ncbi:MAG: hypothetical protein JRI68_23780 [Deltaproteobacteria bacterium]|nr:hypothetical protein [Deltaproteobacteria bacterium]